MNIPFHACHIVIYEGVSETLNPDRSYNAGVHLLAGAAAGGLAAAVTTPLDVCKTLLNTQEEQTLKSINRESVSGIQSAIRTIYSMQGFSG